MNYDPVNAKAAAREAFHGLWAAMTTPFTASGTLDEDAVVGDVAYLADTLHVDGVFCTGVMGEFWALGADERGRAIDLIVDAAKGRFPVLAHTGAHAAVDTIALTAQAADAGADFVVIINPVYPAATIDGLRAWFGQVLEAAEIGVWLFDTNYAGVRLPLALIDELADHPKVCGIKIAHGHDAYVEALGRVGDRILVCEPAEGEWLGNMRDHGQTVFMSSAAPYLYQNASWQAMREYTDLALAGEFDKAAAVSATLDPVRAVSDKWVHGAWNRDRINPVPAIKAWSQMLGVSGGPVRAPLTDLTDAQRGELRRDLEAAGLL